MAEHLQDPHATPESFLERQIPSGLEPSSGHNHDSYDLALEAHESLEVDLLNLKLLRVLVDLVLLS